MRQLRSAGRSPWYLRAAACTLVLLVANGLAVAAPAVFWASDPVRPGEAVLVVGEGLGEGAKVDVARLPDGEPGNPAEKLAWPAESVAVETIQPRLQSLKFVLPGDWKPGLAAFRITGPDGAMVRVVNRPNVWWAQGDLGTAASPGGWVRVLGKNLVLDGVENPPATTIRLEGPKSLSLPATGDRYSVEAKLPDDLPSGKYRLLLHNGFGAALGWGRPVGIEVVRPQPWPATVYDVKQSGAVGDGVKDDTDAVLTAIHKAAEAGGGVVYFPRGRYRLSDALEVPPKTVLRGESQKTVAICWTDFDDPPESLVHGTHAFGLESLTLYAKNHRHVITANLGSERDSGDVFLRHVLVRADAYRGHPKAEQVDETFRKSLRWSTGGGDTVRMGGRNIEIVDCDLYGSGRSLFLSRVRGGRVAGNHFYNGRWGWYCISGSDGLIFENNSLAGADLMSTGGGLNCLDGSSYSQNVYYARNRLSLMHGWDREAMTSDAGGEVYFGQIASAEGRTLVLAEEPKESRRAWEGAGVFILNGRGAGQYRRVVGHDGAKIELDAAWAVPPDAQSVVGITMFQGHYLLVDNEFTDTGAMQFYGTSIECIVDGNRGTRMRGFSGRGLWYHGYQPSWFCQFLDNEIAEGNYYHWTDATDAAIEIYGARHDPYEGPLAIGGVVRRNRLRGNAQIRVDGQVRDAVVEGNRVEKAPIGIFVSGKTSGVLVRNNQFDQVEHDVVDEEAIRLAAEERLKKYMGRREPVAAWSFEEQSPRRFVDSSGNGFSARIDGGVTQVDGGIRGKAARFDGAGCLRVEEPAVFNAPDVTVSLWVKPETVSGRRGVIGKRYRGTAAPWIVSQNDARVGFEATEDGGPWTFNFSTPGVLKENEWTHVAAVVRQGFGVTLYVDGKEAAVKKNPARRETNLEPLVMGRDAWGGDPPKGDTPGFYAGLIDEVKVWTRALEPEEVMAEFRAVKPETAKPEK